MWAIVLNYRIVRDKFKFVGNCSLFEEPIKHPVSEGKTTSNLGEKS
jgi:hypothetical protein